MVKRPKIKRIRFGLLAATVMAFGLLPAAAPADDAPPAPTLASNSATYAPGDTVSLSGASWTPNESVHIHVADNAGKNWSRDVDVTAGVDGSISDSFALPTSFAGGFGATATSALGATATTSFTSAFAAPAAPPTIVSDKFDYTPGETVTLTGANWRAGETIRIVTNDTEGQTWSRTVDVTAASDGTIRDQFALPNYFIASYTVVATGAVSGTATTSFTDGNVSFALATADTVTPPSWTVNWSKHDDSICVASPSTGSVAGPGNVGVGNNKSVRPTSVTPASGYTFAYWSDTATSTTPSSNTCTADAATPRTLYAHFTTSTRSTTTTVTRTSGANPSTYGDSVTFTATVTATGGNPSGVGTVTFKDGGTAIGTCSGLTLSGNTAACSISTLGAGSHNITADYSGTTSGSPQFGASTSAALPHSVNAKPVTITPDSGQSKAFGASDPTLTFANNGGLAAGAFTGSLSRAAGENVGSYAITLGTLSAGANYTLSLSGTTVNFAITPKSVTITPDSGQSKAFGASDPTLTFANNGGLAAGAFTGSLSRAAGENVGNYAINLGTLAAGSNYQLVLSATTVNFTITGKSVTITPNSGQSKVFGASEPTLTFTNDGGLAGGAFTGQLGRAPGENVGSYAINLGTLSAGTNYQLVLSATPVSFSIGKANQTISFAALTGKTFGDADFNVSATASSGLTVTFSALGDCNFTGLGQVHLTGAGSCTITAAQDGNTNYFAAPSVPQAFSIAKAPATLSLSNLSPTYDGSPHAATVTTSPSGLSGVSVTYDGSATAPINAGSYAVVASLSNANYTAPDATGTLVIDKAGQIISFDAPASPATYDTSFAVAPTASSGLAVTVDATGSCTIAGGNVHMTSGSGVCTLTAKQDGNGNYKAATDVVRTVDAAKAAQSITFGALDDKQYGDADFGVGASASSGLSAGFSADGSCTVTGATVHITGAGSCSIKASQGGNANFSAADDVTRSFAIAKAPLTIDVGNKTRQYGDANPILTGSITGIKNGDSISASYSTAATASSPIGDYDIDAAAVGTPASVVDNYDVKVNKGTLKVTKASLTINVANATRKYGDANPAFSGTVVGTKNGDDISPNYSSAADASSPVGPYAIGASPTSSPADRISNYDVTVNPGTLTVTRAPLTITAADASREYGDANPAFSGSIDGTKNGDNVSATYFSAADPSSPVGSYDIDATASSTPAGLIDNYDVTVKKGKLTVNRAPLSVNVADKSREYGEANPPLTGSIVGGKNGDVIAGNYATAATVTTGVGSYDITAAPSSTPAGLIGNYDVTVNKGTLKIDKAPLSAKADDKTKVYGDANPTFTGDLTGVKNSDPITLGFSTTANAGSDVGDYAIQPVVNATPAVLGNYEDPVLTNGTLGITRAPLSVNVASKSREYGDANPTLTGSFDGIKNDDDIKGNYSTAANLTSPIGDYDIDASPTSDPAGKIDNYDVTVKKGKLTVTKAPLAAKANDATKVYGDENPDFSGALTGVKNGDAVTLGFSTAATKASGVGDHAIEPVVGGVDAVLANYQAPVLTNGTLKITRAPLTIDVDNKSRPYGNANPELTGSLTGTKNNDAIEPNYSTSATATSDVGSYDITATPGPAGVLANYDVTVNKGKLTVKKAPLAANADDATKVYGDSNPPFAGDLTGVKNNDPITLGFSTTANAGSDVGDYAIKPVVGGAAAVLANYEDPALTNGTLEITTAPLTVTVASKSREYGAGNPTLTGSVDGVKNGDDVSPNYSTAATLTSPVGDYEIDASPTSNPAGKIGNYDVKVVKGTLKVTKAPLSAKADNKTKVYGDANPDFTGGLTGVKNADAVTLGFSTTATQATGIGDYAIEPVVGGEAEVLANYQAPVLANGTLKITKAPLTVNVADKSRKYGESNPALTGQLVGVKNGDTVVGNYATAAIPASNVASYDITAAPSSDPAGKIDNYDVTVNKGKLTVTRAPLTIDVASKSREYGEANPGLTGTVGGLKNGDVVDPSYSTTATLTTGIGPHDITASPGPANVVANYDVTVNKGTLTITPAPLAAKADDKTKGYGDTNPPFTGVLTGVKNGDAVTLGFSAAANAASGVGDYAIVPVVGGGALLANYQAPVLTNGTLKITKAPLSAKANDATKVYGDANPTFTGSLTGVKNNDAVTLGFSTAANAASGVGDYAIVPVVGGGDVLANYQAPALTNGTLKITKALLSAKANNTSKVVGEANPTFTGSLTGVKNSDAVTLSFATTATQASPVGTYDIVPQVIATPDVLANYQTPTLTNGTLTVLYASTGTCLGSAGHAILQPINPDGTSVFKQGSTVPAKFRACDANGASIGTAGVVASFKLIKTVNGTIVATVDEDVYSTTPDTAFRWSASDQQWIFNISTKTLKVNTTYYYRVTLNDGSTIDFNFGLK